MDLYLYKAGVHKIAMIGYLNMAEYFLLGIWVITENRLYINLLHMELN